MFSSVAAASAWLDRARRSPLLRTGRPFAFPGFALPGDFGSAQDTPLYFSHRYRILQPRMKRHQGLFVSNLGRDAFWRPPAGGWHAAAQTPAPPKSGHLELRLTAENLVAGMPQDFTIQLVNNSDHDVRLPKPILMCQDGTGRTGDLYFYDVFTPAKPDTRNLRPQGGCAAGGVCSPVPTFFRRFTRRHTSHRPIRRLFRRWASTSRPAAWPAKL